MQKGGLKKGRDDIEGGHYRQGGVMHILGHYRREG